MVSDTASSSFRSTQPDGFEQGLVNRIAAEMLAEQRRSRRWNIFFKMVFALYFFAFLAIWYRGGESAELGSTGEHVALVDVRGLISDAVDDANADDITAGLRKAFEQDDVRGVLLRVNSPGGSPVQSALVHDEILRLRKIKPDVPVYAVVTDLCASGCYYIASAANAIYANEVSMVGSVGVVMNGFGFVDTLKKLGVERRLLHAGEHKGLLDPFSPLRPRHVAHVQDILEQVHAQFKAAVIDGRTGRLQESEEVFSGLIWTGARALEMGLIDGFGDVRHVAREIIGTDKIRDYTVERFWGGLLRNFADAIGGAFIEGLYTRISLR